MLNDTWYARCNTSESLNSFLVAIMITSGHLNVAVCPGPCGSIDRGTRGAGSPDAHCIFQRLVYSGFTSG